MQNRPQRDCASTIWSIFVIVKLLSNLRLSIETPATMDEFVRHSGDQVLGSSSIHDPAVVAAR